jgi:hypothetical protein
MEIISVVGGICLLWFGASPLVDYVIAGKDAAAKRTRKSLVMKAGIFVLLGIVTIMETGGERHPWPPYLQYFFDSVGLFSLIFAAFFFRDAWLAETK